MMRARLFGGVLALLLVVSWASVGALEAPQDAERGVIGDVVWSVWAGESEANASASFEAGASGSVFVLAVPEAGANATFANVTLSTGSDLVTLEETAWQANLSDANATPSQAFAFTVAESVEDATDVTVTALVEVYGETGTGDNATAGNETEDAGNRTASVTLLDSGEVTYTFQVAPAPGPAPGPAGPGWLPIAGGALAVLAVGGGAFAVARQRQRARTRAPPRSAALRREQAEQRMERARSAEEKAAVQEEIKQEETQRQEARELQILRAKKADAERMIQLLKQRHEAGQITELQYNKMVEKKQAELDRIEGEIRDFQAGS